jgi:Asp-tRNA(Asn)/Glu-tRNA(Gln) amidotransferase A subunit family amidase
VPRELFWEGLDHETAQLMEAALEALRRRGAVLVYANVTNVAQLDFDAGFPAALYEMPRTLDAYLAHHNSTLRYDDVAAQARSPDVRELMQSARGEGAVSDEAYHKAIHVGRPALQKAYRDYLAVYNVEAVVVPTTPRPAGRIGLDDATFIRNTSPASTGGLPSLPPSACPPRARNKGYRSASCSTGRRTATNDCWRSRQPSRRRSPGRSLLSS